MKSTTTAFCVIGLFIAFTSAAILERKPFKRLIPADVLRDFRGYCFASTECRVIKPGESWSLAPFCGNATCVALEAKDGGIQLAEEVTDCGPLVDLDKSKGCQLVKEKTDSKAIFPGCCPVYDCEEGTEVIYVSPPAKKGEEKEPKSN